MRLQRLLLLAAGFYIATPAPDEAQSAKLRHADRAPLSFSISVSASRPDLSVSGLLIQAGMGLVGGLAGATVMAIPAMLSESEDLAVAFNTGDGSRAPRQGSTSVGSGRG